MKKTVMTLALLLLFGVAMPITHAAAQTSAYQYMTFTMQSGSEVSYSLSDFKITYGADSTYIESAGSKYSLLTAGIAKMKFTETATAIKSATLGGNAAALSVSDNAITINSGAITLRIFSADGTEVLAQKLGGGGTQSIDLSVLPKGIYILKAGSQTVKFRKK